MFCIFYFFWLSSITCARYKNKLTSTNTNNMKEIKADMRFLHENLDECSRAINNSEKIPIISTIHTFTNPLLGLNYHPKSVNTEDFNQFKKDYRQRVRNSLLFRSSIYHRSDPNLHKRIISNIKYAKSLGYLINDVQNRKFSPQKIFMKYNGMTYKLLMLYFYVPLCHIASSHLVYTQIYDDDKESLGLKVFAQEKLFTNGVFVEDWDEGEIFYGLTENDPDFRKRCISEEIDLFFKKYKRDLENECIKHNISINMFFMEEKCLISSKKLDVIHEELSRVLNAEL